MRKIEQSASQVGLIPRLDRVLIYIAAEKYDILGVASAGEDK